MAVQVEDEVLRDGEVGDDAVGGPVLRHEPEAGVEHLAHRPADQLDAVQLHRAGHGRLQPEHDLGELRLAVALHTGDRDDLPARDVERHVVDLPHAGLVDDREVAHLHGGLAGHGLAARDAQLDRAARP